MNFLKIILGTATIIIILYNIGQGIFKTTPLEQVIKNTTENNSTKEATNE